MSHAEHTGPSTHGELNSNQLAVEYLHKSLPTVTPNPHVGLRFAMTSYDWARKSSDLSKYPSVAAEAAALAELRGVQAGEQTIYTDKWNRTSLLTLLHQEVALSKDVQVQRAHAFMIHGQSVALRFLIQRSFRWPELEEAASRLLNQASKRAISLVPQQEIGVGQLLAGQASANEAVFEAVRPGGNHAIARHLATRGLNYASFVHRPSIKAGNHAHRFMQKSVISANGLAFVLAASHNPALRSGRLEQWRRDHAIKLLSDVPLLDLVVNRPVDQ